MNKKLPKVSNYPKALDDIISSFSSWRIFYLIGVNDVRKRYARSKLGQFWIVLSLAINIGALALVLSLLLKVSLSTYLPFIAIGTVIWTFISGSIIEGANLYINHTSYIKELSISKLSYLNSLFVKNIIIFLHNVIFLGILYFIYPYHVSLNSVFLSTTGLLLTLIFLYPIIMVISIISLRFRDFPNMIASGIQLVYYLTPIMWKEEIMPKTVQTYLMFNPFAVFLSICRNPLIGSAINNTYWISAIIYIILSWLIAFPFYSKYKSRIVYWI